MKFPGETHPDRHARRVLRGRCARVLTAVLAACAGGFAAVGLGSGAGFAQAAATPTATWQYAPAEAPPAPTGVSPAPYPVPVGEVGQISFWSPNLGLLITGGTQSAGGIVAPGLYVYNGADWQQLSSVCGGAEGRIAWVGPDEFWTIADQRPSSDSLATGSNTLQSVSLCHFQNGQVVGSYAMPLGQSDSYEEMDAASCLNADDCWFGGSDTTGSTPGAFQLHWDGGELTALQETEDHAVNDMTIFGGQIYESVRIMSSDTLQPGESSTHTAVLHAIGTGESGPFTDVYSFGQGQVLPAEGTGVLPDALTGLSLGVNAPWGALSSATDMWGAANPVSPTPSGSRPAKLTVLLRNSNGWSQVLPSLTTPSSTCTQLPSGATVNQTDSLNPGTPAGQIAPMPGTDEAWLSLSDIDNQAAVALINSSGCVQELDELPDATGDSSLGYLGDAGAIACPAQNDCWLATDTGSPQSSGWLLHYTDGTSYPVNTDPAYASVITARPADGATPTTYSTTPPPDDSLADQQTITAATSTPATTTTAATKTPSKPVDYDIKVKIEHKTTLVVTFKLRAAAKVQLQALVKKTTVTRNKKTKKKKVIKTKTVVAKTKLRTLKSGSRSLTLKLNPKRWPNALNLSVKAIASGSSSNSGGGDQLFRVQERLLP